MLISMTVYMSISSDQPTKISVGPAKTFVGSTGKNFTINIDITNANETFAWQFNLTWDPSVLNISSIEEGTFLSQWGNTSLMQGVAIVINYTEGWALIANTYLSEPVAYPTGSGTLAIINFTVMDVGNCTLSLHDTELIYKDGETAYEHTTQDGEFYLLLGDINRNGLVDAFDLFDLSKAYESNKSMPNWNPECDLNCDDKVNASDLFALNENYGKEW